jgi:hypothetical protein
MLFDISEKKNMSGSSLSYSELPLSMLVELQCHW